MNPFEYFSRDGGATRLAIDWTDLDEFGCMVVAEEFLRGLLTQAGYVIVDSPAAVGEATP